VRMSETYRLHARPTAVSRAPTFSENFESGPSRRCRVPRQSTSSEEQMEIDAFWRGGARPALQPDGGRNLFQKKFGAGLRLRGRAGPSPPPAQSRAGRSLGGLAHPPPSHGLGSGCGGGLGLAHPCISSPHECHQGSWGQLGHLFIF
jgi:hypothetical protein